MNPLTKFSCALLAFCFISVTGCSKATPPAAASPTSTWRLQPLSQNATYENGSWNLDMKVLVNGRPATREQASSLASRLRGVYAAAEPNGGGETNQIIGFWQRKDSAGLTMQVTYGKERFPAGTVFHVTVSDIRSEHEQAIEVGLRP